MCAADTLAELWGRKGEKHGGAPSRSIARRPDFPNKGGFSSPGREFQPLRCWEIGFFWIYFPWPVASCGGDVSGSTNPPLVLGWNKKEGINGPK